MSKFGRRFFSAFQPLRLEKIIKVPPMGESIQEGTLTQWHKKIGDFVKRDEQVSTIETDKIDAQVNSTEAGKILEFYAQEGDTVQVGANLFKVFISNDAKEPVVNDSVESKAKSDDNKPSKSTKPSVNSTKELAKQTQGNEYHRVPLIKFLGPRNFAQEAANDTKSVTTAPKPINTTSSAKVEGNRIIYESVTQLPKRFRQMPYSNLEMDLINGGGAYD